MGKLRDKHARFAQEYLIDLNATQAALRAGYSPKTAHVQGHELLKNPKIAAAIAEGQKKRGERTQITADRVHEELGIIGLSDIGNVLSVDGNGVVTVRSLDDLTPQARRCIESIKQTSKEFFDQQGKRIVEVQLQVKLHPKVAALSLLMDHLGMKAAQKHEHAGKDGGPIETSNVRYVVQVPKEEPEDGSEVA